MSLKQSLLLQILLLISKSWNLPRPKSSGMTLSLGDTKFPSYIQIWAKVHLEKVISQTLIHKKNFYHAACGVFSSHMIFLTKWKSRKKGTSTEKLCFLCKKHRELLKRRMKCKLMDSANFEVNPFVVPKEYVSLAINPDYQ